MAFKNSKQRKAVMALLAAGTVGAAVVGARSSVGRRLMKSASPRRGKRMATLKRKRAGRTRMRDQQSHAAKRAYYSLHGRPMGGGQHRFKRTKSKKQKKGGMFKALPPNPKAMPGFKKPSLAHAAAGRRSQRIFDLVEGPMDDVLANRITALKRLKRMRGG